MTPLAAKNGIKLRNQQVMDTMPARIHGPILTSMISALMASQGGLMMTEVQIQLEMACIGFGIQSGASIKLKPNRTRLRDLRRL